MDLIDRAEVQYKMLEIMPEADSLEWYESAKPDEVKDLVDELYSIVLNVNQIDAQPVKHGKWSEYSRNGLETYVECTNCCVASRPIHLQMVTGNGSGLPDYCPNCGADMRGDKDGI